MTPSANSNARNPEATPAAAANRAGARCLVVHDDLDLRLKLAGLVRRTQLKLDANLIPGRGGIFEVRVGDQVVAKREHGHFPDNQEVVAAVSSALRTV